MLLAIYPVQDVRE